MEAALRHRYREGIMDPFEAYCKYIALKNHFTQKNYDYFKYNGKISAKRESFETRRDKYFFYKLAKRKDVEKYLLANMVDGGKNFWIGEMREHIPDTIYAKWRRRNESLTYTFKEDLNRLDEDFDSNFKVEKYGHPHLLRLYLRDEICIETMIILDMLVNYTNVWNKKLNEDLIWGEIYHIMNKYRPFLSINTDKFKQITIDMFTL